jgi:hypothetical protein
LSLSTLPRQQISLAELHGRSGLLAVQQGSAHILNSRGVPA